MVRRLLAPRMLALHAVALLATVAALALGAWQYQVWQSGREDRTASLVDARPVPLGSVLTADQAFPSDAVGEPVRLAGRWLPGSTMYVANRHLHGRRGVWVVTPVAVCRDAQACSGASAMLVVRGWSPSVRQAPAAPSGGVQVTGWLQPGEGAGVQDPEPHGRVISQLRIPDAIPLVPRDLYGGYVIARDASHGSVLRPVTPSSLPQASGFTSIRNLLYAVEWWFFAAFAVYMWWRWCRDEVTRVTGVPSNA